MEKIRSGGEQKLQAHWHDGLECTATRRWVEPRRSRPRSLIDGANDYAAAFTQAAARLDRYVGVCDASPVFAPSRRHPGAEEVVVQHVPDQLERGLADFRAAVGVLPLNTGFALPLLDVARHDPVPLRHISRPVHDARGIAVEDLPWT